jgi:hypothetical protein
MRSVFLSAVLLITGISPALATCSLAPPENSGLVIEGEQYFKTSPGLSYSGRQLHLQVNRNTSMRWLVDYPTFSDPAWICATFWFPETATDQGDGAGLVFWKTADQDYYVIVAKRNGWARVYQHTASGWAPNAVRESLAPLRYGPQSGGSDNVNTVEAIIINEQVQIIVNDERVMTIDCCRPKGSWSAGIWAEAPPNSDKDFDWVFGSASIVNLPLHDTP